MGTQGSAAHNFKQIGVIRIDINEIKDDKIFELAIDAGADDCFSFENFHEIHCGSEDIYSIKKKIESDVENFISTEICLLYTSPSPRDLSTSRMPSSA